MASRLKGVLDLGSGAAPPSPAGRSASSPDPWRKALAMPSAPPPDPADPSQPPAGPSAVQRWESWAAAARSLSPQAGLIGDLLALLERFVHYEVAQAVVDRRDADEPHWSVLLGALFAGEAASAVHDWYTGAEAERLLREDALSSAAQAVALWARAGAPGSERDRTRARLLSDIIAYFGLDPGRDQGSRASQRTADSLPLAWLQDRDAFLGEAIAALTAFQGFDWQPPGMLRSFSLHPDEPPCQGSGDFPLVLAATADLDLCERAVRARRAVAVRQGFTPPREQPGAAGPALIAFLTPWAAALSGPGPTDVLRWVPRPSSESVLETTPRDLAQRVSQWALALGCVRGSIWLSLPDQGVCASWLSPGFVSVQVGSGEAVLQPAPEVWMATADPPRMAACRALCAALGLEGLEDMLWALWPETTAD